MREAEAGGGSEDTARARKRRETLMRITEAGVRLFIERGFDGTTVDAIASAAGISRRSFFHHVKSKDDILLSLQSGMATMIVAALAEQPDGKPPLHAARDAILDVCGAVPADEMLKIDRLMRSSAAVQARKQASYVEHEKALFAALRKKWPDPARSAGLRLVAMVTIGALRLSTEAFGQSGGADTFEAVLRRTFDALEAEALPG